MDDGDVQAMVLMKFEHRAFENGIKASVCPPSPKGAIDAGIVNLPTALAILFDGPLLPLAAQFRRGAATPLTQMRQDKLLELRDCQFRWNPLSGLASRHLEHQSNGILAASLVSAKTLTCCGL
ncbi:MAG: hypothetical protein JWN63_95 [Candidatus Acidoferrum typicum]|nr:hypothetical protein [Candidatus Acidoferrum typicum]